MQPDNTKHTDEEDSCSIASSYPLASLVTKPFFFPPFFYNILSQNNNFLSNSRTAASVKTLKGRTTLASAPTFRCSERAEKRREVGSSLIFFPVYAMGTFRSCCFYIQHIMVVFKNLFFLQFYSRLEEKHQALEAEKNQCEARTKVYFSGSIFNQNVMYKNQLSFYLRRQEISRSKFYLLVFHL